MDAAEREHGPGGHDKAVSRPRRPGRDAGRRQRAEPLWPAWPAVPQQLHHLHSLLHQAPRAAMTAQHSTAILLLVAACAIFRWGPLGGQKSAVLQVGEGRRAADKVPVTKAEIFRLGEGLGVPRATRHCRPQFEPAGAGKRASPARNFHREEIASITEQHTIIRVKARIMGSMCCTWPRRLGVDIMLRPASLCTRVG